MTTGAVVLCAGGGLRFGGAQRGAKLLAPFRGKPLVVWALEHAAAAGFDVTLAVTGPADIGALVPAGVEVVPNPQWQHGLASSLQRAVRAARELQLDAIVVGLADQPLVGPGAWRAVAASASPIAVATYGGARRHPVRLSRAVWPDLPASGEEGARLLMKRRPGLVEEVACTGDPLDIDTVEDLARAGEGPR